MNKLEIIANLNKAISQYEKQTNYKVLEAYITKSDVMRDKLLVFIRTDYPSRNLPSVDFRIFHNLILEELGELKQHVELVLIFGANNSIPFENNVITNPGTGDTYVTLWRR
jgi:hypothetical protein